MADIALPRRQRAIGLTAAIGVQLLFGWILVAGLALGPRAAVDSAIKLFAVAPPPPLPAPQRPVPPPEPDPRPSGAASPPNLVARATPVVAPEPIVRLELPSPVIAAPVARDGFDPDAGAAPVPGPGYGAGGRGDGFGSGWGGDGDGGGGRRGERGPEQIGGTIRARDFLADETGVPIEGVVEIFFTVQPNGSVTDCGIETSSGNRQLDTLTCRLAEQRFRFRPARDAQGRAVRSTYITNQYWIAR